MISALSNRIYSALFSAQVIALIGTGLLTVALGLLAYDLAEEQAGSVLGTAYAIKMIAYVGLSPIISALVQNLPRKTVLIAADLVRAGVALMLPFVDAVWQIYVLIFALQAASATFTPTFQATIPDILQDEEDYTQALSLSRLAYDLENLISPMLAGLLLSVVSYHWLFMGTVFGFVASALLVLSVTLPAATGKKSRPFRERLTRGSRIYLATPRLRGLWALTLTAASASAFVLVNTVVMVRSDFGLGDVQVAIAMAAYGGGSMLGAIAIPFILHRWSDRFVMMIGAALLTALMLGHAGYYLAVGLVDWSAFLLLWALGGFAYASIITPSGRLLRNSAHPEDRPGIFAAQFALSHVCWLITYPVAGWAGGYFGLPVALSLLGILALFGLLLAWVVWPASTSRELDHDHPDLPDDHPHLKGSKAKGKRHRHRHVFVIDDEHRHWPTHG